MEFYQIGKAPLAALTGPRIQEASLGKFEGASDSAGKLVRSFSSWQPSLQSPLHSFSPSPDGPFQGMRVSSLADGVPLQVLADEVVYSAAMRAFWGAPQSHGVCEVGAARRPAALPPIAESFNLGGAQRGMVYEVMVVEERGGDTRGLI